MILYKNIVEVIQHNAESNPTGTAYQWLDRGETEGESFSFSELYESVKSISAKIDYKLRNSEPRQKIVLMFEPSLEFISVLFGCMAAQHIGVPVSQVKPDADILKVKNVILDSGAILVLTSERYKATAEEIIQSLGLSNVEVCSMSDLKEKGRECTPSKIEANETAFYQYTSGSTGQSKGVEVTHQNIMCNQAMIKEGFQHSEQTVFVGWLPLYHDMGLIGNVMQPLFLGIPCYLMSPFSFVQKPIRWLQAISKYRATTSGGPNFGYDLCVSRIDHSQCDSLDLSSWSVAYNGSEPVRADTLQKFSDKFARYGFDHNAHFPCYGMAESTLFVTGSIDPPKFTKFCSESIRNKKAVLLSGDHEGEGLTLVSCGVPSFGQKVVIVNPKKRIELEELEIGEIWVQGENVAKSYINKKDLTEQSLYARIEGEASEKSTFLRTGDLGFLSQGELYVTGRIKDLIIIRGKNYYPHDIERSVSLVAEELESLPSAAIYDDSSKEKLVVLQEVGRSHMGTIDVEALTKKAKLVVNRHHDITLAEILFLKPNSIPRTTSGKVRRQECLRRYQNREFDSRVIRPLSEVEATLSE